MNARRVGRLGVLAVGLGIGAAWAHTPVASADTSSDWLSSIDSLLSGAVPAADPAATTDLAISFDGVTLFHEGSATATTTAGDFDFAIASGANSEASATGGFGDSASASGAGSTAEAGGGFGDYASATGGAGAIAGDPGATGNNLDSASASGIGNEAWAGNSGAYSDTTGSSFDSASASGGTLADPDIAYAGFNGSGDTAHASGQNVEVISGFSSNPADPANNDTASAYTNLTTPTTGFTEVSAGGAGVASGSGDTAFVIDPSGTVGSTAIAGEGFNYDLAGVFGDGLHATATGANFLVDILPAL